MRSVITFTRVFTTLFPSFFRPIPTLKCFNWSVVSTRVGEEIATKTDKRAILCPPRE
jgi:hypothetical protein